MKKIDKNNDETGMTVTGVTGFLGDGRP